MSGECLVYPSLLKVVSKSMLFKAVSSGFEYLQGQRLHYPSGQHVPVFDNPHGMKKKAFSYIMGDRVKSLTNVVINICLA